MSRAELLGVLRRELAAPDLVGVRRWRGVDRTVWRFELMRADVRRTVVVGGETYTERDPAARRRVFEAWPGATFTKPRRLRSFYARQASVYRQMGAPLDALPVPTAERGRAIVQLLHQLADFEESSRG